MCQKNNQTNVSKNIEIKKKRKIIRHEENKYKVNNCKRNVKNYNEKKIIEKQYKYKVNDCKKKVKNDNEKKIIEKEEENDLQIKVIMSGLQFLWQPTENN